MRSLTRKRGATADSSSITPIKRARRAYRDNNESDPDESDLDIKSEHTTLQETNIKAARTKRSKVVPLSNGTDQPGGKDTATQEINQKAQIHEKATKTSQKRSGNSMKAQKLSAKVEEEDVQAQSTPKKARKRKAADHKEEADPPGTDPIPKKAKGKRKTKQEKEAEAMPLAVRTTGLRMFIGAHVSGAKGGNPMYIEATIESDYHVSSSRCAECRDKLSTYWVRKSAHLIRHLSLLSPPIHTSSDYPTAATPLPSSSNHNANGRIRPCKTSTETALNRTVLSTSMMPPSTKKTFALDPFILPIRHPDQ